MSPDRIVALFALIFMMLGLGIWIGWEFWGKWLKLAHLNARIMDAGYRAALQRATDALAEWERTRGGWQDDGTTTVPAATAMLMSNTLGYSRQVLEVNRRAREATKAKDPSNG